MSCHLASISLLPGPCLAEGSSLVLACPSSSPVNRHVQDALGMLQVIRQQGVSDRIKSGLFAKRRLGSQKKDKGG